MKNLIFSLLIALGFAFGPASAQEDLRDLLDDLSEEPADAKVPEFRAEELAPTVKDEIDDFLDSLVPDSLEPVVPFAQFAISRSRNPGMMELMQGNKSLGSFKQGSSGVRHAYSFRFSNQRRTLELFRDGEKVLTCKRPDGKAWISSHRPNKTVELKASGPVRAYAIAYHARILSDSEIGDLSSCYQEAADAAMKRNPSPRAGDVKTVTLPGGAKLELVYCPPGEFQMGSPVSEEGRDGDENQHHVTLTKGFWIGKYEVTQAQWKSVMGNNPSDFNGDNHPVENVSWDDCQEFLKKAGLGLRLPTEAEWEYACRAGTTGPFAGTGRLDEMGWYGNNSGSTTHPVGQKKPNAWGLYDMHGNVWEWCQDWRASYDGDARDPQGPASGDFRVGRGGSWSNSARNCRSAYRSRSNPSGRDYILGFRVACSEGPDLVRSLTTPEPLSTKARASSEPSNSVAKNTKETKADPVTKLQKDGGNNSQREAGDIKTVTLPGGAKLELVYCPPGEFLMGSPTTEAGRDGDENQHRVTLTKGFWIGKYEVTQAQWKSVMGNNPSSSESDDRPVENVSWNDCQEFLKKAGLGLRLPTEAEWEYACRAGSTGPYSGTGSLDEMGWYYNNSGDTTYRVGKKKPNAWGLYDMHGNVLERCQDWYGSYNGDARDPQGPASGGYRVFRGGSWDSLARSCRSAFRYWGIPGNRGDLLGFRVACSLP